RLDGDGRAPFLGTAKYRFNDAGEVQLRLRTPAGGVGQVHWRLADEEEVKTNHVVKFDIAAGKDWHEVNGPLPSQGQVVQLRVYLAADKGPGELSALSASAKSGTKLRKK